MIAVVDEVKTLILTRYTKLGLLSSSEVKFSFNSTLGI